jgi:methionyl aminopeptidase
LHRFARCASTRVVAPKAPLTAWQPYVKHAVSPWRTVPAHIARPPYADTGDVPECMHNPMEIKNDKQIAAMRRACAIADETRAHVGQFVKPGVSTDELDLIVHDFIIKRGAFPSPLNYRGFPKSMCASVNDILCHGIPDHRKLIDGDIVSIDISCFIDGVHGDCCGTFLVGNVAPESESSFFTIFALFQAHCFTLIL